MIWIKGAHQSAKLQTFSCSSKISPTLYFDRLLLLKVYKILAKKYREVMSHETEDWCKIWRKHDLSKLTKTWWNLTRSLESLKNLHFYLSLLYKVFNVWPKKLQGGKFSSMTLMSDIKFEEKLTCGLEKTWQIWKIFTRALESFKIGTLMESFNPK